MVRTVAEPIPGVACDAGPLGLQDLHQRDVEGDEVIRAEEDVQLMELEDLRPGVDPRDPEDDVEVGSPVVHLGYVRLLQRVLHRQVVEGEHVLEPGLDHARPLLLGRHEVDPQGPARVADDLPGSPGGPIDVEVCRASSPNVLPSVCRAAIGGIRRGPGNRVRRGHAHGPSPAAATCRPGIRTRLRSFWDCRASTTSISRGAEEPAPISRRIGEANGMKSRAADVGPGRPPSPRGIAAQPSRRRAEMREGRGDRGVDQPDRVRAHGNAVGVERAVGPHPGRSQVPHGAIGRDEFDPATRDGTIAFLDHAPGRGCTGIAPSALAPQHGESAAASDRPRNPIARPLVRAAVMGFAPRFLGPATTDRFGSIQLAGRARDGTDRGFRSTRDHRPRPRPGRGRSFPRARAG